MLHGEQLLALASITWSAVVSLAGFWVQTLL
jgi:hypothetical protein